jgi:hypothetical protein
MYRVRMIGRDTLLYLNQYSSSLSDICTDTFLVTLYDQAPDGSVVIADGIKFQWSSSACYTGTSEEEKRENLDVRFEGGRILVLVPKRGDLRLSVYSSDGRRVYKDAVGYVEQTFEGKGVYFVVVDVDRVRKVKKVMLKP